MMKDSLDLKQWMDFIIHSNSIYQFLLEQRVKFICILLMDQKKRHDLGKVLLRSDRNSLICKEGITLFVLHDNVDEEVIHNN